jgi:hypothetical protein
MRGFSANASKGRVEIGVRGAGNDRAEAGARIAVDELALFIRTGVRKICRASAM